MDAARYAALFQSEAREHLGELDAALLALEQAPHGSDAPTLIATLFRGMHTIKGMAAAMGYTAVERLSHALESRCEPVRAGSERLTPEMLTLLFDGTDAMRVAIDAAALGRTETNATVDAMLARLRARRMSDLSAAETGTLSASPPAVRLTPTPTPIRGLAALGTPALGTPALGTPIVGVPAVASDSPAGPLDRRVDVRLVVDCPLKGVRAMLVHARLAALGTIRGTVPPLEKWQDDRFDGVFSIVLHTAATVDALTAAVRAAGEIAQVRVRDDDAPPPATTPPVRTVRLDARRLDSLLELVGELVITRDRLVRAIETAPSRDRATESAARDAARLIGVLQEEILQARLLPVSTVFDRFPRVVRDVARDVGKSVTLVTEGRDIEIDRSLLDAIGDPVLHLLRNALDHGIEDAETRRLAGKSPTGTLVLRALRDRAAILIQVQDDGRGIDQRRVLQKAKAMGLVAIDQGVLSDDQLLQVLAHPGLSTAAEVTALSGRGVGVDIVNTRVRALGGQLEVRSELGRGTTFTMRLPVSLAILRALIVDVGGMPFALPVANVLEALEYPAPVDGLQPPATVTVRDETLSLVVLHSRFADAAADTPIDGRAVPVEPHLVVVDAGGRRGALLVDRVSGQQDIIVKPMDLVRGAAPWFSGATVLGDGQPALIVDIASVL